MDEKFMENISKTIKEYIDEYIEKNIIGEMIDKLSNDVSSHVIDEIIEAKVQKELEKKQFNINYWKYKLQEVNKIKEIKETQTGINKINNVQSCVYYINKKTPTNDNPSLKNISTVEDILKESDSPYTTKIMYENTDSFDFKDKNKEQVIRTSLKNILDYQGKTQTWLAKETGITNSTLFNIINNPSSITLINAFKIAHVLKLDIRNLFYMTEIDNNEVTPKDIMTNEDE